MLAYGLCVVVYVFVWCMVVYVYVCAQYYGPHLHERSVLLACTGQPLRYRCLVAISHDGMQLHMQPFLMAVKELVVQHLQYRTRQRLQYEFPKHLPCSNHTVVLTPYIG